MFALSKPKSFALACLPVALSLCAWQVSAACTASFTPIAEIQGAAKQSPVLGKTLTTQGVVLGVIYPDSKHPALLIQSQQPDKDPKTSEALQVVAPDLAKAVQAGQLIRVTGTVREMSDMTSLTNISASTVCAGTFDIPKKALRLPVQHLSDWESLEGQWLTFEQTLVVNDTYPLARYGEILLADRRLWVSTEVKTPGETAQAFEQLQQLSELWLDDHSTRQNPDPIPFPTGGLTADKPVRVGDEVSQLQGFLVQTKAGYRLLPTATPTFTPKNVRTAKPQPKAADSVRVASFNVLNYFTGALQTPQFPTKRGASNAEELDRQQAKMIAALAALDADVIGLLEVENNGYGQTGALATLVRLLNKQLGSEQYQFIQTPVKPGTDDIKVALIYRPAAVTPTGNTAIFTEGPFVRGSRVPLTQSFAKNGSEHRFTVSVNHFKSKGSCPKESQENSDQQDGQSCWNPARVQAAKTLSSWLATQPTGIETPYQLIIGDLNAYRMEDPITTLEKAGFVHLPSDGQVHWSYVFRGRSGSLDHALASAALHQKLVQFEHWHINADEPAILDYNTEFKSNNQLKTLFAPTPFRSSDHDPLVMDFKF